MTQLYYSLICKIIRNNKNPIKICVLGDKYQSIYDFNNSDSRYIEFADQLFIFNNLQWSRLTLSTSFRVTDKIADFINNCMFNNFKLDAVKKSNHKPKYYICNVFPENKEFYESYKELYNEFKNILNFGYEPSDIFILAPSLQSSNCPVRLFENHIKKNNPKIPIYVPTSDDAKIDHTVIDGKIIFSTFHQAKGMERKVVFVFNFDDSYFKYYK